MSGAAEASLILGLISGIVTVVDTIKRAYEAAHDASGLPEAFREVADRMNLVKDTLHIIERHVSRNDALDDETMTGAQQTLESCREKAEKLEAIFHRCIPDEDTSRFERYVKALKSLGKGSKVELLMKGILEAVQDLVSNIAVRELTAADEVTGQVEKLTEAIETMSAMKPSVEDDMIEPAAVNARNAHTGVGDMYNASGSARQFNAKGNARQYHAETMSFGKDG